MKLELTTEQLFYLQSLNSKKKQRKFLLNCLIDNLLSDLPSEKEEEKCDACRIFPRMKNHTQCESCSSVIKHFLHTSTTAPRTFEGILNNNAKELLQFDNLQDYPGKRQQKLFNYLVNECNFTALQSQMHEIERIVLEMNK